MDMDELFGTDLSQALLYVHVFMFVCMYVSGVHKYVCVLVRVCE